MIAVSSRHWTRGRTGRPVKPDASSHRPGSGEYAIAILIIVFHPKYNSTEPSERDGLTES